MNKPRPGGERILIPDPHLPPEQKLIQFSFKHLDFSHSKFLPQDCPTEFWIALAHRLKGYSYLSLEIFLEQNNPDRRHVIDFRETTEPNGFTSLDLEQLSYEEPWQFDLGTFTPWRVHGTLIDEMFYIIWLDHSHRLYP
jgi:hypothetical protein